MFPDPDNSILLKALLIQLDGKIDWPKFAEDIGADNMRQARNRLGNFKKKHVRPVTSSADELKDSIDTPKQTRKLPSEGTPRSKKRKASAKNDEQDIEWAVKDEYDIDDAANHTSETPTRKMRGRHVRQATFKEEPITEEWETMFEDSGHGGTDASKADGDNDYGQV